VPPFLIAGLIAAATPVLIGSETTLDVAESHQGHDEGVQLAQLIFHSRVVIRVERAPVQQTPTKWSEHKGPKCVPMADILGAAVLAPQSVDIVLRGGQRMRARFGASCPGLDYYSGFYIVPPADAKICADRDVVRDRAGGECAIDKFRKLVPQK
jgi:hypothetical protein